MKKLFCLIVVGLFFNLCNAQFIPKIGDTVIYGSDYRVGIVLIEPVASINGGYSTTVRDIRDSIEHYIYFYTMKSYNRAKILEEFVESMKLVDSILSDNNYILFTDDGSSGVLFNKNERYIKYLYINIKTYNKVGDLLDNISEKIPIGESDVFIKFEILRDIYVSKYTDKIEVIGKIEQKDGKILKIRKRLGFSWFELVSEKLKNASKLGDLLNY